MHKVSSRIIGRASNRHPLMLNLLWMTSQHERVDIVNGCEAGILMIGLLTEGSVVAARSPDDLTLSPFRRDRIQ